MKIQGKYYSTSGIIIVASYLISGLQQFQGNLDNNTIVRHYVPRPAMVKSVHIIPIEWETNFAIRLEFYGCIAGGHNIGVAQHIGGAVTLISKFYGLVY